MKITFTADDGTVFDTEADCLGWERFCQLREQATDTLADPNDSESWDQELWQFLEEMSCENGSFSGGFRFLWRDRRHLYRLVELMKQAEAS